MLLFLALDNIDNDNDINKVTQSVSQWHVLVDKEAYSTIEGH